MWWTLVEVRVGEQEGGVILALVTICLTAAQTIDIRAHFAIAAGLLAQIAEHVVEGAVLHHEHHDVVDVGQ